MALTSFEIAVGGVTAIPVISGLVFLTYKGFLEKNLDISRPETREPIVNKKKQ
ncbi:hypothetical protein CREGCYN_12150 [Synechococcus sp. M16CYN]